jgi:hypothetical protein
MTLPKLTQPIYTMVIPSTQATVRFRPFTVKEEKLLMMVKEGPDATSIAEVYKQLVNNCVLDRINVDEMAAIDIEYVFLQLRSKSVGNIAQIKIKDPDDGQFYEVEVDLESVEVANLDCKRKFQLTPEVGIVMRWPTFKALIAIGKTATDTNKGAAGAALIKMCLDTVWDGDNVYKVAEFSAAEVDEFVDSLGVKDLATISEFFNNLPYLYTTVQYVRADKTVVKREVRGLQSFF